MFKKLAYVTRIVICYCDNKMDKKSDLWCHFDIIDGEKVKCLYCSNVYSYKGGSTANLSTHHKGKHYSIRGKKKTVY